MQLKIISDTHGQHNDLDLGSGQVLIHCGDFCKYSTRQDANRFIDWFESQDFEHRIYICGNHDKHTGQKRIKLNNTHYLQDSEVIIEGVKFYGSPYTPRFFDWYWMAERFEEMAKVWEKIPLDTDVLITHGPAHGLLDVNSRGEHCGCEELALWMDRAEAGQYIPKVSCFGHIHEAYGICDLPVVPVKIINASVVNERYELINKPVVVDLSDSTC